MEASVTSRQTRLPPRQLNRGGDLGFVPPHFPKQDFVVSLHGDADWMRAPDRALLREEDRQCAPHQRFRVGVEGFDLEQQPELVEQLRGRIWNPRRIGEPRHRLFMRRL